MGKPLYMQLEDLQHKYNRLQEHTGYVKEELAEAKAKLREQGERYDNFVVDVLRHFGCEVDDEPLHTLLSRDDEIELVTKARSILEGNGDE